MKRNTVLFGALLVAFAVWLTSIPTSSVWAQPSSNASIESILKKHCVRCHGTEEANGDVNFSELFDVSPLEHFEVWESTIEMIQDGVMPPQTEPRPSTDEINQAVRWYETNLVASIQAHPGFARPRRLSAHEYRNTLHSVIGFPLEVAVMDAEQTDTEKSLVMKLLQDDPPGPSGFKNDTSTNPLTTVVWDQYSYLVDFAVEKLLGPQQRSDLEAIVGPVRNQMISHDQALQLLRVIGRRAQRRPVVEDELSESMHHIRNSQASDVNAKLKLELKGLLMSPRFIYRGLLQTTDPGQAEFPRVDQFEFAERLSYFLWADMPDHELLEIAESGKLRDTNTLRGQVGRMLSHAKSRRLAEHLGVEWFSLNQIDQVSDNPPVRDALKSQPVDFLHELFTGEHHLLELIDSQITFINPHTAKYYPGDRSQLAPYKRSKGIEIESRANEKITIKDNADHRGGLLTMPGILAMNRGPILRGTWILQRILGERLPEPPPNVGQVPANPIGKKLTFRERFELHRKDATCAACHDRIDPIGFALQAYDSDGWYVLGKQTAQKKRGKRDQPIDLGRLDTSGRLPSGEEFADFQELKQLLTTRQRARIIRNIIERFLSYALCRDLKLYDQPTIDHIQKQLDHDDATFRDLIFEIVTSLPFQHTAIRQQDPKPSD